MPKTSEEISVDATEDGDAGLSEHMCDLSFAQARSVVFKRKLALGVVDGEAAKAVCICEFAERAKLRMRERRLQFKFHFEERHTQIIAEIQNCEPATTS